MVANVLPLPRPLTPRDYSVLAFIATHPFITQLELTKCLGQGSASIAGSVWRLRGHKLIKGFRLGMLAPTQAQVSRFQTRRPNRFHTRRAERLVPEMPALHYISPIAQRRLQHYLAYTAIVPKRKRRAKTDVDTQPAEQAGTNGDRSEKKSPEQHLQESRNRHWEHHEGVHRFFADAMSRRVIVEGKDVTRQISVEWESEFLCYERGYGYTFAPDGILHIFRPKDEQDIPWAFEYVNHFRVHHLLRQLPRYLTYLRFHDCHHLAGLLVVCAQEAQLARVEACVIAARRVVGGTAKVLIADAARVAEDGPLARIWRQPAADWHESPLEGVRCTAPQIRPPYAKNDVPTWLSNLGDARHRTTQGPA